MIVLLMVTAIIVSLMIQANNLSLSSISLDNEYAEGLALATKAEGFLEDAALKYLRNPNYNGGSLEENNIICTITVNNVPGGKDLISSCQRNQRSKVIAMTVVYNNGAYNFSPMEERESD